MAKAKLDDLTSGPLDEEKQKRVAEAIKQLTPEEAEFFIASLEAKYRKGKLQIMGYLVAMLVWAIAMFFAWVYYGTHDGFVGWVFLLPFALVAVILLAFGKWADHVGKTIKLPTADPPPKPE